MRVDRSFWCKCLTFFTGCVASVALCGPLDARLTFSQDGGKSWSGEFPTVVSGAVIRVRAAYTIADSWEKRDVICASIHTDMPFASHTKKLDHGGYMQRHPQYWRSSLENGAYVWDLNTGGLSLGTHVFMLDIGYWRQNEKGKGCEYITDSQPFYIWVK